MIKKPILYTIFILFSLILVITFFWLPKYQEIKDLKLEIKEKEIDFKNKDEYFLQLKNYADKFKEYSSELAKINSGFPSSAEIVTLLDFITDKVENNLFLNEVKIGKTVPLEENLEEKSLKKKSQKESLIKETYLDFSFIGSYPAFKNFLAELQNSSRLINIKEISFKTSEERKENFSFNLKIKVYSY